MYSKHVPNAPDITDLTQRQLQVSHISIYEPAIVASSDQIGLAGLTINLRVVNVNDLLAFPVPLDRLRFTGIWPPRKDYVDGGSVIAESQFENYTQGFRRMVTVMWKLWSDYRSQPKISTMSWASFSRLLPRNTIRILWLSIGTVIYFWWAAPQKAWDLLSRTGEFTGIGTCRMSDITSSDSGSRSRVRSFAYDASQQRITAQVQARDARTHSYGILVQTVRDKTPIAVDYNAATRVQYYTLGGSATVTVAIDRDLLIVGDRYRTKLFEDCNLLREMTFVVQ